MDAMRLMEIRLIEQFPIESRQLDRAAETFEAGRALLFDQQGRQIYSDMQHRERMAALLVQLDGSLTAINSATESAIQQAQADLTKLDGADPLDALSTADQARAAAQREFVKEDARRLPPGRIVQVVATAMANDDKAMMALWHRYLGRRAETEKTASARAQLGQVFSDLKARVLGDPAKLGERRQAIEQRIESAKLLTGRTSQTRRMADGSAAATRQYARL